MKILDKTEDGNLDEQEKIKKTSQETEWELKPQYVIIALVVFVTFCCCILFFFMIYRYNGFTDFWKKLSLILQPIIIGVVIAYLLNPIMKFLEGHLLKFLEPRMKSKRKAKKTSRGIAITGSLVFLVGICVLLVAAIVPSISASIQSMITSFPQEAKDLTKWVDEVTNGDTELASMIQQGVDKITDTVETFFEDDIFSKVQTYLTSITSGVIYGVKFVLNVIVGLIISVYVMADQEHFAGQAKKIVYAMFKPVRANVIVDTVRKSNEIFSGFISGKILDSAIIGVLAYIVLAIMKMPDTVLVAVIIGVTNVIPFFGLVYRRGAVLYHYRASESDTGIIFPDLYRCVTADRRKYHWTEDPWKLYRIIGILGCICNSGIWRIMGIPGNAARCAVNGSDLLCCTENGILFLKEAWTYNRYTGICISD